MRNTLLKMKTGASAVSLLRRVIGTALSLAALSTLPVASPSASETSPRTAVGTGIASGRIGHAGRWLTDDAGRVVVVHGVNMPSKLLPAYPAALRFNGDDAALLVRLGFNAVRVTVERYAVSPRAGVFDAAYVGHIARTVRLLARHGIMTLLDFHQDQYGPVFLDNGYPDWMTLTDGIPPVYMPFPFQYFASPAMNRAFDHLWANDVGPSGRPLQTDDAAILSYVAAKLRHEPGILGYEIINEPWPGTAYPSCIRPTLGCREFDEGPLSAYYGRIVPALRRADPKHMIWYEPLTTFNTGIPTYVNAPKDARLGFAFHDYAFLCGATNDAGLPVNSSSLCEPQDEMVMSNALERSARTKDALLVTEFGATMDPQTLTRLVNLYDRNRMPWLFWSYTRYILRLSADGKLLPATDENLNSPIVQALARPYPQLVSGTPLAWGFDPATKVFTMRYTTSRVSANGNFPSGSRTSIAVPKVQYPKGYGVSVRGGTMLSANGAPVLEVAPCRGSTQVAVTVSAAARHSTSC